LLTSDREPLPASMKLEERRSRLSVDAQLGCLAPATANNYLKIIKIIFRSARLESYLLQDPAEGIKTVKSRE
jgi:hypothetical protein